MKNNIFLGTFSPTSFLVRNQGRTRTSLPIRAWDSRSTAVDTIATIMITLDLKEKLHES